MQEIDICKLQKKMKKVLEEKRYLHTLGVAYTAANLAFVYGYDDKKAFVAGLLHDVAKCISHQKRLMICKKNHIEITPIEEENPVLLHAKVGAFFAKEKYGVCDEEILNAIRFHTTGRPEMTLLEKIIYVADFVEPHRKKLPRLAEIRKISFEDLDMAIYMILENSLNYLEKGNAKIDKKTEETYLFYKKMIEERGTV
jgi:predicted HD superfamily hydrolase involved in NAD metabolism